MHQHPTSSNKKGYAQEAHPDPSLVPTSSVPALDSRACPTGCPRSYSHRLGSRSPHPSPALVWESHFSPDQTRPCRCSSTPRRAVLPSRGNWNSSW
ncbi:hypothetical protein CALVIDRAFT_134146 [Calocera viscosa TUFC12733]|uniref:Uncharacterized protein n=1 Tax=Calocera viscosa (strain TUFC12733) TaxID=1330018 RepID=A0A167LWY8_CALVF|nr:hypothetical protein CALVIDRAFT_134146 [Calocera viscosa TUFC12733]